MRKLIVPFLALMMLGLFQVSMVLVHAAQVGPTTGGVVYAGGGHGDNDNQGDNNQGDDNQGDDDQ